MSNYLSGLSLAMCLLIMSCTSSSPLDKIQDKEVRRILERALETAGGMNNFLALDSVTYEKRSVLYYENGAKESEVSQIHKYQIRPELKATITWKDTLGNHGIFYSEEESFISLNGTILENSGDRARSSFLSSYFVLFVPFKIIDPGTSLSYEGRITLDSEIEVDVIRATYDTDVHNNHSTNDEWQFYFDKDDGTFVANSVYHPPTYALIENNETSSEHPIGVNLYRKSWRVDKDLNKQYLRGEFWYDNYHFISSRQSN